MVDLLSCDQIFLAADNNRNSWLQDKCYWEYLFDVTPGSSPILEDTTKSTVTFVLLVKDLFLLFVKMRILSIEMVHIATMKALAPI